MRAKKKILICAYNFPPLNTPQSLRWFYLSRELQKKGHEIDIITLQMTEEFQELLDKIPDEINIHRVFPGPFHHLTFKYSREPSHIKGEDSDVHTSLLWNILTGIHLKIYKALNLLLFPDIYIEWLPFALKKGLDLLRKNKYDAIISSSDPKISHFLGYFLKRKSGIPWIADYGDPWITPLSVSFEPGFKKRVLGKIEGKMARLMHALTVTTERTKEYYLKRYPFLDNEKIHVVTQGFDAEAFSRKVEIKSDTFRIVYCGSLYRKIRDPINFFEAFNEIQKDDMEVLVAGRINEFAHAMRKEKFGDRIKFLGYLEHHVSLALEKGATVLLYIGNISDIQVPGKIYEYFGAGRPILALKGGDRDDSAAPIVRYNRGLVVQNRKEDIKEAILKLYKLWQRGMLQESYDSAVVEEFTWQAQAEKMNRICEEL
jgi:glycosyltransferase involved in cell wall biosynthesis